MGLVLVAANRAKFGKGQPETYAELMQRYAARPLSFTRCGAESTRSDVFGPLGMNGSHFLTTNANKHVVVAPSLAPEVAVRSSSPRIHRTGTLTA